MSFILQAKADDLTAGPFADDWASHGYVAMGVEPDAAFRDLLEPDLHRALTVGRPIAATPGPG